MTFINMRFYYIILHYRLIFKYIYTIIVTTTQKREVYEKNH